jgi:PhzF family phenazine biosynthesis protein
MATRRFSQVDVFSTDPLAGNPLAVVLDGEGLSDEEMQRFALWMNLSETTFLLPPTASGADYRARIFSLGGELAFAGHPTLGSCHAWLEAGGRPAQDDRIVQECGVGLVPIRRIAAGLAFEAPPRWRSGPLEGADLERAVRILGLRPSDVVAAEWVANGPAWMALLLGSADAVLAVEARPDGGDPIDIGLVGPHPPGSGPAYEVRALFSDDRGAIREDPVTGSLNASVAQWLLSSGRVSAPYVASQGTALGRRGRVHISQDEDGAVWVGGATTTVVRGTVGLDGEDGPPSR